MDDPKPGMSAPKPDDELVPEPVPEPVAEPTTPDGPRPAARQSIARKPVSSTPRDDAPAPRKGSQGSFRETASARGVTPPSSLEIDKSQPHDFDGELSTNNELPSIETLKRIEDYYVLDRHGKTHTFKSLYSGHNVARRVLVIFVRHFFCGNCQEFLRSLSECITPDALLRLPVSTFIAVVGCGDPALIDMYVEATKCPFPVYTDPKRSIFDALEMTKTWELGTKPAYMRRSMTRNVFDSVFQALKQVPAGKVLKSGDQRQVGGEFLFEPLSFVTPVSTPQEERKRPIGAFEERGHGANEKRADAPDQVEEKKVTWCHRMKTTRDHAEVPELMEVLGLDGQVQPVKDERRWSQAMETRKGVGESMAKRMSQMNMEDRQRHKEREAVPSEEY